MLGLGKRTLIQPVTELIWIWTSVYESDGPILLTFTNIPSKNHNWKS